MRAATSFITLLLAAPSVSAWGQLGHRTVAYLAAHYLSQDATDMVNQILQGEDISNAAVWADDLRSEKTKYAWSFPWHFIDGHPDDKEPEDSCGLDFPNQCGSKSCVVFQISNQSQILAENDGDSNAQQVALKFLLHFVGDVHQPLHTVGLDIGGNSVYTKFNGSTQDGNYTVNLHSAWDSYILRAWLGVRWNTRDKAEEQRAAYEYADALASQQASLAVADDCTDPLSGTQCPMEWARETNQFACTSSFYKGLDWIRANDIYREGDYFYQAANVIEGRIFLAGNRLAAYLNALAGIRQTGSSNEL